MVVGLGLRKLVKFTSMCNDFSMSGGKSLDMGASFPFDVDPFLELKHTIGIWPWSGTNPRSDLKTLIPLFSYDF